MIIFGIQETEQRIILFLFGFKLKIKTKKLFWISNIVSNIIQKYSKVKNNKILIWSSSNGNYNCNVKYIADELLSREESKNLDLVWVIRDNTEISSIPDGFRLVNYDSYRFLYEFISAKALIANAHMFLPIKKGLKKSKDTVYFQTFHGSMGIKKIDADATQIYDEDLGWLEYQKKSAEMFDYLFIDSEFERKVFKSAFWGNGELVKLGKARDSIFYKDSAPYIEKVKEYYGLPKENKILLYAPTWRNDKRCFVYNLDINMLKETLRKRFGGEWSILIRPHQHMKKKIFNILFNSEDVIDCSDYIDMQELLVASDILISDYSSCVPEYTILGKPSFLYAQDYNQYKDTQGFYYPLETLPSPLAENNYELAQNILNFDEEKFKKRNEEFLVEMGHQDDENSCKRIVDFIFEKIGVSKND